MHVAIDARFYGPSRTGLGRYTAELVQHIITQDPSVELTLFVLDEHEDNLPQAPQVHLVPFPHRWYSVAEQRYFPGLLHRTKADLFHFPHFNVPLLAPRPFVVTIHDLILHDYFPAERASTLSPLQYMVKRLAYRLIIRQAVHRADHILAVSKATARDIERVFHIPDSKVTVTYEAVSPATAQLVIPGTLDRFQVRPGFLLYVGNTYPHKNLTVLLKAFQLLLAEQPTRQLVLAGKDDYFSQRLRAEAIAMGLNVGQQVIFTGFVTDAELAGLYQAAGVYVFPSLAEGFGLPPLEAMAAGVPVASSNASCLPEVLGEAAEYFDPRRPRDLAAVVKRLLNDQELRERLRRAGHEQVQRYSWSTLAAQTLDVYRSVVRTLRHA